jgi:hypothetical protein
MNSPLVNLEMEEIEERVEIDGADSESVPPTELAFVSDLAAQQSASGTSARSSAQARTGIALSW